MANLTDIVRSRRSQGASVTGALAGGIKERLKEKFDPRQLINQRGLLTALFPGLRTYQAKTSRSSSGNQKSINKASAITSDIKPLFEDIQFNTKITAKNLSVLPSLHRDFNVIRQNFVKLLKLEKMDARTKADMYFIAAQKREEMYEAQLMSIKGKSISPTRTGLLDSNTELLKKLLIVIASISVITLAFKGVKKAIDTIMDIDLKKAQEDFVDNIQSAVDDLFFNIASKIKWSEIEKLLSFNSNLEEELSKKSFASLSKEQKEKFLDAQIKAQSLSIKDFESENNPAKLIFEEWQKKFGGKPDKNGYSKFPSSKEGRQAQSAWWEDPNNANLPLNEALRKFAKPKNEEDYQQYLEIMSGSLKSSSESKTPTNTTTEPSKPSNTAPSNVTPSSISGDFGLPFIMTGYDEKIVSHQGFRTRKDKETGKPYRSFHEGIDVGMPEERSILSVGDGTVVQAGMFSGYGQTITIKHGNTGYYSRYAHLKKIDEKIKVGAEVTKGQKIGESGGAAGKSYSGNSEAPHLHYEIRKSLKSRKSFAANPNAPGHELHATDVPADKEPSLDPRLFHKEFKHDKGKKVLPVSSLGGGMINSASFDLAHADLNNNIPPILITVNKYIRRNNNRIEQESSEEDFLPHLFQTVIL